MGSLIYNDQCLAFGDLDERITSQFSATLLGDLGTSQLRSLGSCKFSPSCSRRISTIFSFSSSSDIITLVVSKYFMDFNPKNGGNDLIQLLTHIFFKLVEKLLITQITWVLSPASPASIVVMPPPRTRHHTWHQSGESNNGTGMGGFDGVWVGLCWFVGRHLCQQVSWNDGIFFFCAWICLNSRSPSRLLKLPAESLPASSAVGRLWF